MGPRFLGHSLQQGCGGVSCRKSWRWGGHHSCPVGDTQAGVGHGVRHVWVWEKRRNWLPWFESQQKGEFRVGGQGEQWRGWSVALERAGSDVASSNLWKRGCAVT